jgi:hypothetical protein
MPASDVLRNLEESAAQIADLKSRVAPHARLSLKREQTLFLDIEDDLEAVVTIQIKNAVHGTSAHRRPPTVEELHRIADLLCRRVYQFHPNATLPE